METIELLNNQRELIRYVIDKLFQSPENVLAAQNNTLDHFHFVGCSAAESIICSFIDTDCEETLAWFTEYLDTGEGRANPLNRKISETFWLNSGKKEMSPEYRICFWHGMNREEHRTKDEKALMEKIEAICTKDINGDYTYKGTLDDFAKKYVNKFMYLPANGNQYHNNLLCVTQYSNFGQR